jgi:hypothetical protein
VPDGTFAQDYNRYTYARNNPLVYTDPDGNFWNFVIGAALGGVSGWQIGKAQGAKGWGMVGFVFGGAMIGGLTAGIGDTALGAFSTTANNVGSSIAAYSVSGAVAGMASGASFAALSGGDIGKGALMGGLTGGALGALGGYLQYQAIGGAMKAAVSDRNYWLACVDCAKEIALSEVVIKGQRSILAQGSPLFNALVEINRFNPLAIVVNSLYGYVYGYDTSGNRLTGTEATANLLSLAVPGGRGAGIAAKTGASLGAGRTGVKQWLQNAGNLERGQLIKDIEGAGFKKVFDGKGMMHFERGGMKIRLDPPQPGTPFNHMHLNYGGNKSAYDIFLNPVNYKSPAAHIPIR